MKFERLEFLRYVAPRQGVRQMLVRGMLVCAERSSALDPVRIIPYKEKFADSHNTLRSRDHNRASVLHPKSEFTRAHAHEIRRPLVFYTAALGHSSTKEETR